ncbi:unnamed protein product [Spodoptera exigua]|nr:unnamed protein product [Spodoptera exigua]
MSSVVAATSTTFTELTLQTNAPPVISMLASLKNEPRGRPKTLVDNDELKAIVEADDTQSTAELAAAFDVSVKTISVHLRQIGKVKKLDKWVRHELNDRQREVRVETCFALLNRHTNGGILNRIVTCDEKWILFDNRKRSARWLDPGSAPKQCPKRKLTPRKVMATDLTTLNTREAVQNAFEEFVASRPADFFKKGINKLPLRWQRCIDCMDDYFD